MINFRRIFFCIFVIIGFFGFVACKQSASTENSKTKSQTENKSPQSIAESFRIIDSSQSLVKTGDLILRTGRDFTSNLLRNLSLTDKTYSHCGIAAWEDNTLYVYHIIGGEGNPDGKVRKDSFSFFCNPYENLGFGVFRYDLTKQKLSDVMRRAHGFYDRDIRFDMNFDLATDSEMYCSEFVYKALMKSGIDYIPLTIAENKKYVAIDNLYLNPHCQEIKRFAFP